VQTYEIRLLDGNGDTVMIHVTSCGSAEEAQARATSISGVRFDRFEIWHGGQKLAEGRSPEA
jgi:hypothetical protein